MSIQIRSALPGRTRWDVAGIIDRDDLVDDMTKTLLGHAGVSAVVVNALTGRVLVQFEKATPLDDLKAWIEDALSQAKAAVLHRAKGDKDEKKSEPEPYTRLLRRAYPHRRLLALTVATSFLDRVAEAVPSVLLSTAVDVAADDPTSWPTRLGIRTLKGQLAALGAFGLLAWLFDAVTTYGYGVSSSRLVNALKHDLRSEAYAHLQGLDLTALEKHQVTEWNTLLQDDIGHLEDFVKGGVEPVAGIAINVFIAMATMFSLSPQIAMIQVGVMPLLYLVGVEYLQPVRVRTAATRQMEVNLNNLLAGNVAGLSTINAFNAETYESERVREASEAYVKSSNETSAWSAAYGPLLRMVVGSGFVLTLIWGGSLVRVGRLTIGAYSLLVTTSGRMFATLSALGGSLQQYQRYASSLKRVFDLLDMRSAIVDGTLSLPPERAIGDVVFENVVFGYDPAAPVFRGIDCRFQAGKTTALVGTTGAGKSTILKLLLRFYDVQSGAIRLDGIDIRELKLSDLRGACALVSQQVFLFAGTIRENIALSRPDATMEQVIQAAQLAEAHGFIDKLPEKYDTPVGERGERLSGGQRQRIAIARAVLADRPILLFDEATAAVDNETEASIQRSLREFAKDRTTIIVAHRLSTVRHADVIYVLDEGGVRERGTHDELIAEGGVYAMLWRVQTGEAPEKKPLTKQREKKTPTKKSPTTKTPTKTPTKKSPTKNR